MCAATHQQTTQSTCLNSPPEMWHCAACDSPEGSMQIHNSSGSPKRASLLPGDCESVCTVCTLRAGAVVMISSPTNTIIRKSRILQLKAFRTSLRKCSHTSWWGNSYCATTCTLCTCKTDSHPLALRTHGAGAFPSAIEGFARCHCIDRRMQCGRRIDPWGTAIPMGMSAPDDAA